MLKPPLCVCVCVCVHQSLRILCPFNHGSTPCGALRLNHSRRQCLTVYVTGIRLGMCGSASRHLWLCLCVYVPPLLWSGNGMWMGSPCVLTKKKRRRKPFLSLRQRRRAVRGRRSSHEWQRGSLVKSVTLLHVFQLSLLPAHLIALSSEDNIRHAPHVSRVRGHIISDIAFLLSTYL